MKKECEICNKVFTVYDENEIPAPELVEDCIGYGRLPVQERVYFTVNPFQAEIYEDYTEIWLCWNCYYNSAMDI